MLVKRLVSYSHGIKTDIIQGTGKLGNMISSGGKLTALACHLTKQVSKTG
jgi:hypothetical protein